MSKLWAYGDNDRSIMNNVNIHKDIPYLDTNHKKHMLNIFVPQSAVDTNSKVPVLIFIHGGSWRRGDRNHRWFDTYNKLCIQLCNNMKCITVNVGYRLSPEVKHPEHMLDVLSAFKYIDENIDQYLGDRNQIILCGHSAGGHLALMCTLFITCPDLFEFKFDYTFPTNWIKGVVPISAVYDVAALSTMPFVNRYIVDAAFDKHPEHNNYEYVSPLSLVKQLKERSINPPPMLCLNAQNDWGLEKQTIQLMELLNDSTRYSSKHYSDSNTTHLSIIGLSSAFGNPYICVLADLAEFSRTILSSPPIIEATPNNYEATNRFIYYV
jgi:hypothetical protein